MKYKHELKLIIKRLKPEDRIFVKQQFSRLNEISDGNFEALMRITIAEIKFPDLKKIKKTVKGKDKLYLDLLDPEIREALEGITDNEIDKVVKSYSKKFVLILAHYLELTFYLRSTEGIMRVLKELDLPVETGKLSGDEIYFCLKLAYFETIEPDLPMLFVDLKGKRYFDEENLKSSGKEYFKIVAGTKELDQINNFKLEDHHLKRFVPNEYGIFKKSFAKHIRFSTLFSII